MKMYI